jgi:putative flippase GtrA
MTSTDLRGIVGLGTGLARGTISVPVLGSPSPPGLRRGGERATPGGQPGGPAKVASQAARFVVVGVASTAAFVLLYLLFRVVMAPQAANAASLLITAIVNTAVNRWFTFGIRGRAHATRHQLRGLIAFGIGLAVTSGALAALHTATAQPGRAAEVAVLVLANLVATVVRFMLYRGWVFRAALAAPAQPAQIQPNGSAQ